MTVRLNILLLILFAPVLTYAQVQIDTTASNEEIVQSVVTGHRSISPISGISDGRMSINLEHSDLLPRFAGSVDPIRVAKLLPGVQTTAEGDCSFFIRGGDISQSSMTLNGAPLYSFNHLLGLFSTFNPNHIKSVEIEKSGVGAAVGQAPGPSFDVRTSENVAEKLSLVGDVGVISSQATLAVPIGRKASLTTSARFSYSDWLISVISPEEMDLGYGFQDYDATLVWALSPKQKIIANCHAGFDKVKVMADEATADGKIRWYNIASSVRLLSRLSDSWSASNTVYYSSYSNIFTISYAGTAVEAPSSVDDLGFKSMFSRILPFGKLDAGFNFSFRNIMPQIFHTEYNVSSASAGSRRYLSHEIFPFVSLTVDFTPDFTVQASARYGIYKVKGNRDSFVCSLPEPDLRAEYRLPGAHRLRASYSYGSHYKHLISLSNISFSTDFWMPATSVVPPLRSHNASFGYHTSFFSGSLRLSAEAYYRYFNNVVEYDLPVMSLLHSVIDIEDYLYSGDGEAYGLEFLLNYSAEKVNVMLGYTLGYSVRQFDELNGGKPFPAKQDRRHDLSFSANWRPSVHWDLGLIFTYASGSTFTAPMDFYMVGGSILRGHGSYNGSRLPDYHRMDLAVTYWFDRNRRQGLNFSVYNCYARKNPFYISWPISYDKDSGNIVTSVRNHRVYTVLPSLSWIFKF